MAETMILKTEPRTRLGTKASRALRARGKLPVVIYGHGEPPITVSLDEHNVEVALSHGVRIFDVDVGGKTQRCLIKEVQYDPLSSEPIHVDLARVDVDERVKITVGIELRGVPKGVSEGGVLDQHMAEIVVECLVSEIPDTLHPTVTDLAVGESILVADLPLPDGVVALADGEERVATVAALAIAAEPEVVEETEGDVAEPERIGRVRKEEEGESKT